MSEAKLDQIVKGAPPPNVSIPQAAAAAASHPSSRELSPERAQEIHESKRPASSNPSSDPLATLPSSPPQIYLNLLILEASLRAQYLTYRARRHLYDFYLTIIIIWISACTWLVFYREREDGKGRGGSPYGIIDASEKIAFGGGILSAALMWGTGQWDRGVRWPRRWIAVTNRGLRVMNLKIVVLRRPWWIRLLSSFSFLFPYSSFYLSQGSSFQYIETSEKRPASSSKYVYRDGYQSRGIRLEDTEPGGNYIKLLLLPKPFSPEFRENWELFRAEYWEKENQRRADLRRVVKRRNRDLARQQGGFLRWSGWRGWRRKDGVTDLEQLHYQHLNAQHPRQQQPAPRKRRQSLAQRDSQLGSHSRSSSRSSTGTPELDEAHGATERRGGRKGKVSSGRNLRQPRPQMLSRGTDDANKRSSTVSMARSGSSDGVESETGGMLLGE